MSAPLSLPPARGREERAVLLGIETATALGAVALCDGAGLLGEVTLRNPESHSERILPAIERLLAAVGVGRGQIAAVAVSAGPGSFTGLRTGIAAAKGLALALDVPLYAVATLAALAENAAACGHPVCAVLDARRGEYFRALYRPGRSGLETLCPEAAVPAAALARELPPGCTLVGEWPPPLREDRADLRFAPAHLNHPRAAVVARQGLELARAGRPSEIATLAPRYLRPSDAEAGRRPGCA